MRAACILQYTHPSQSPRIAKPLFLSRAYDTKRRENFEMYKIMSYRFRINQYCIFSTLLFCRRLFRCWRGGGSVIGSSRRKKKEKKKTMFYSIKAKCVKKITLAYARILVERVKPIRSTINLTDKRFHWFYYVNARNTRRVLTYTQFELNTRRTLLVTMKTRLRKLKIAMRIALLVTILNIIFGIADLHRTRNSVLITVPALISVTFTKSVRK